MAYAPVFKRITTLLRRSRDGVVKYFSPDVLLLYWRLGEQLARLPPASLHRVHRDITFSLPPRHRVPRSVLSYARSFYLTYAETPALAQIARQLSWRHNKLILAHVEDPCAREFYLRMSRSNRWLAPTLRQHLIDELYEQTLAGCGGEWAAVSALLEGLAPPQSRLEATIQLLCDNPTAPYEDIAYALGDKEEYVRLVARHNGLMRQRPQKSPRQLEAVAVISAKRLGISAEAYRAHRAAGERWCTACEQWLPRGRFPVHKVPTSYCHLCNKELKAAVWHQSRVEAGIENGWIRYRMWWQEIAERLHELPAAWQDAFLSDEQPSMSSMARALGIKRGALRWQWVKADLPTPPLGAGKLRWEFESDLVDGRRPPARPQRAVGADAPS